eukprot:jgi/Hompol1/5662/HPOL_001773-RA
MIADIVSLLAGAAAVRSVAAAATVNVNDPKQLAAAAAATINGMTSFYPPNVLGAIPDNPATTPAGHQWYESGVMWGTVMEYTRLTRDTSLAPLATAALANASFSYAPRNIGSFLGPVAGTSAFFLGRWNDDIMWYGLASLTAAEIFGKDALMPRSTLITYLKAAVQNFEETYPEFDKTHCGGGMYWSRDRTNWTKDYKSTISNAQAITLAARLSILTGNSTYMDTANLFYAWLKSQQGTITPSGHVFDGVNNGVPVCSYNIHEFSYNSGTIIGALAWMYKATGNQQYIADAGQLLTPLLSTFTKSGVFYDLCEDSSLPDATACTSNGVGSIVPRQNQIPPKGLMIRGLMYLYMHTPDAKQKAQIKTFMDASFNAMLPTCSASLDSCSAWWLP